MRGWNLCWIGLSAVYATAQPAPNPFVVVDRDVFFAEPARQVSDLTVGSLTPMTGGRYAVMMATDVPKRFLEKALKGAPVSMPARKCMVWDTSNDKVYPVQLDTNVSEAVQVEPTSDPSVGIATVSGPGPSGSDGVWSTRSFRVDFSTGAVRAFGGPTAQEGPVIVQTFVSPTKPFAVRVGIKVERTVDPADRTTQFDVEVFDLEGKSVRKNRSTVKGAAFFDGRWGAGGTVLLGTQVKAGGVQNVEGVNGRIVLDPSKATVVETAEKFDPDPEPVDVLPLTLELHEHVLTVDKETSRPVQGLWLAAKKHTESTRALVAADCSGPHFLAPDMSFVAYVSGGRLFRSEILKGDYEIFRQAKLAAERTVALSNAKQVALAALLFASDNKDRLPGTGEFSSSVMPYLKNDRLLDGFVWTFQGGNISDVKEPAKTEIGYITVPGGRCVAYVDGHARYVKDP
ncbi:MAG: hypothetical protein JST30_04600 [Armatimonadetes bacterium]|nr:hypothetical protein [Armatimonadota bacterium]